MWRPGIVRHVNQRCGPWCWAKSPARAARVLMRQPLSANDARITADKGIMIERRTVSKYRDSMQPPAVEVRRRSFAAALAG